MRLNPHFPGWYRLASIFNAYRTRDYRGAIDAALRIQMPGYFWTSLACAAAVRAARRDGQALEECSRRPEFARSRAKSGKWFEPDLVEHSWTGSARRGWRSPRGPQALPHPAVFRGDSGAARADEGFWVAVLPFKYGGANAELTALAEG